MKYYKTTFDLNVPTKDRVAVAANSDYGLAVELWKNGEKVQLAASDAKIVDGATTISADSTDNGLAVFNLSSSFEGGSKVVTVAFDKPSTVDVSADASDSKRWTRTQQTNLLPKIKLSALVENGTKLTPANCIVDTTYMISATGDTELSGPYPWPALPEEGASAPKQVRIYKTATDQAPWYANEGDKQWSRTNTTTGLVEHADYVEVGDDYSIGSQGWYRLGTTGQYVGWTITAKVNSKDAAKGNFLLELAAEDKGAYFKKDAGGGSSGGDTTLSATTAYTNWVVSPAKWTVGDGTTYVLSAPQYGDFNDQGEPKHGWYWVNPEETELVYDLHSDDPTETSLSVSWQEMAGVPINVSFSREAVVGYQLGDQSDKILADRNTVKNLVAGVVEDFGPWHVFSDDGTAVSNARVVWSAGGNAWIMYDGSGNVIGEAENGEIGNNLIFCEGSLNLYAYRRHTFTCPNGVEIQAAPSVNGFSANIDTVRINHMVVMGLLNHYGANLYVYSD